MTFKAENKDRREKAVAMGKDNVPVKEIAETLGASRKTIINWLEAAGVKPTMLRSQTRRGRGESVRNTPLALSIEEGVRKRIEKQTREEEKNGTA